MAITITADSIPELQIKIEQLQRFNELQKHAKRLCSGGYKNFNDAMMTFATIKADTETGQPLESASILADGWMKIPIEIDGQQISIDGAMTELIAKYKNVSDYMLKIQAAYAAIGGGEFFPGLK